MKKFLILPIFLSLMACDNHPSQTQTSNTDMWCFNRHNNTTYDFLVQFITYQDYATAQINDHKYTLSKISEHITPDAVTIQYQNQPNDSDDINAPDIITIDISPALSTIDDIYITYLSDHNRGRFACFTTSKFAPIYPKPNETEICIQKICDLVQLSVSDEFYLQIPTQIRDDVSDENSIHTTAHVIPAEEAIKITPNWDYNNPKLYDNTDGVLNDYERDACDTLQKLQQYITEHDIHPQSFKAFNIGRSADVLHRSHYLNHH